MGRLFLVFWFVGAVALSMLAPSWWTGLLMGVVGTFTFFDLGGSVATWRYRKGRQREIGKENVL